jgi:hypothetical protein
VVVALTDRGSGHGFNPCVTPDTVSVAYNEYFALDPCCCVALETVADMNCASYWPMSRTIHSLSHHGTVREDHTSAHLVSSHSPIYLVSPFFVYGNTPIYVFYVGRYIWFRLRVLVTRRDTFLLRLLSPSTPLLSCHSSPP